MNIINLLGNNGKVYPKYLSQDVDVTWHPKASANILKADNINSGVSETGKSEDKSIRLGLWKFKICL